MNKNPSLLHINWKKFRQAYAEDNFGEKNRESVIRQPICTYSNAFMTLASLAVLIILQKDHQGENYFTDWYWTFGTIYSATLFILSLGSAIYHASLTFWGEVADNTAMYLWPITVIFSQLCFLFTGVNPSTFLIFLISTFILSAIITIYFHKLRRYLFALLCSIAFILEISITYSTGNSFLYLVLIIALAVPAMTIWIVDIKKEKKSTSWFQLHGLFHFLASVILLLSFLQVRMRAFL